MIDYANFFYADELFFCHHFPESRKTSFFVLTILQRIIEAKLMVPTFPLSFRSFADPKTEFWKMTCFRNLSWQGLLLKNTNNVWCIKFCSKHSSNAVCLLRNLMHQTLIFYVFLRHPIIKWIIFGKKNI